MKKRKKVLSVLCAAAMLTSMLAGCGKTAGPGADTGKDTSTDTSTGTDTSTDAGIGDSSVAADNGKTVKLVWYIAGTAPNKPDDVVKALNEKSAADIGVTVDFQFQGSDDVPTVSALTAGDTGVDIVTSANWFADYRGSAMKGYFVDLTELLPGQAPELWEKLPDILWDGVKVDNRIYGVPTWKDTAETQYWIGEKDLLEELGATEEFMNANVRLDSMTPVLEKIHAWMKSDTENNRSAEEAANALMMDKRGDWSIKIEWDILSAQELEIGVKNFEEEKPVVQWMYDDPEYVEDLKTLKKWADAGLTNGIAAAQVDSHPRGVVSRGVGWDGAQYTVWGGEAVGYDTILAAAGGPFMKSTAALGSVNCIPLNSKNVDAAIKYLQYINTNADYRNMLAYGVEGVNYEVVDGKFRTLTGYDWVTPNYTMASFDLLLAPEAVPDVDMYKKICDGVNSAPENTLMGFTPDLSGVQNEVAACSSIVPEYAYALHRGDVKDVDAAIAEYKAALDKLGLQDIISELQRQVDEYIATK